MIRTAVRAPCLGPAASPRTRRVRVFAAPKEKLSGSPMSKARPPEKVVQNIHRKTRRRFAGWPWLSLGAKLRVEAFFTEFGLTR